MEFTHFMSWILGKYADIRSMHKVAAEFLKTFELYF